ncbi:NADAR family protein [Histomonas meleagridis]|uniref:NADAR family protein n=1 Tax=Histomonas meleagridis TaxID=135588 RepID=UPI003559DDA0|nr:NADAR family protein [Histomonas meleagridis]KAH0805217.1 NADAR family protein [Histomonas meleagridis]
MNQIHYQAEEMLQNSTNYNLDWLKAKVSSGEKVEYLFFWGHQGTKDNITKSCLSQWWPSSFEIEGHTYNCMEQYMMAEKARIFGDEEIRREILSNADPKRIKALGRKVKNFDGKKWDEYKNLIVVNGNYFKFSQNPDLHDFLKSTGDKVLVEASPYDKIWGIGIDQSKPEASDPFRWRGTNLLGFNLMRVRDLIQ